MSDDQRPFPSSGDQDGPRMIPVTGAGASAGAGAGAGAGAEPTPEWAADLAPAQRRRVNPVTAVLLAVLLLAGGFVGGIAVQRAQAQPAASSGRNFPGAGFGRFASGFPSGFPSGGANGGFGGFGGGTPVASGTVASVGTDSITVTAQDGSTVTVKISATTTVSERGSAALQTGAQVQVLGTKAADGSIDATAIVTRRGA